MDKIITKRTYIIEEELDDNVSFTKSSGNGAVYINSYVIDSATPVSVKPITVDVGENIFVVYFSGDEKTVLSYLGNTVTFEPTVEGTFDPREYSRRATTMLDDDTSYMTMRVNPKLTGNVKVVVDSNSNMYLDTFKVSLGLSQEKYRHIAINPDEYYGKTLMAKMKSMPSDDFYRIEDSCYDLFATANDYNDQYYDTYNCGVRTNTDKMYDENYAMLAPLCIRKVLPDFFLIFRVKNYEDFIKFDTDKKEVVVDQEKKLDFISIDNCDLVKVYDFRDGTNLGKYIRHMYDNQKDVIGDVFTGYDYNHFNIFNGISLDRGVVTSIYEETASERLVNNQVAMNDWYTLGFQRNRVVSKDIINFEFMFNDESEELFSMNTYFGLYVRLNGEDNTISVVDVTDEGVNVFDTNSINGSIFDPSYTLAKRMIYGISTPNGFVRLSNNIINAEEVSAYKLYPYKNVITIDSEFLSDYQKTNYDGKYYVSVQMNDVLDPGEHYRIIDKINHKIYNVLASNYFDDGELSDVSQDYFDFLIDQYTQSTVRYDTYTISIINTDYRSNISDEDKQDMIKRQLTLITKAFNAFDSDDIVAYNDNDKCFSVVYTPDDSEATFTESSLVFEKVTSLCGFNQYNEDLLLHGDYDDKSSYIFGYKDFPLVTLRPNSILFNERIYYPVGFEQFGYRKGYIVNFKKLYSSDSENTTSVLIHKDINNETSNYKTILYLDGVTRTPLVFNPTMSVSYIKNNPLTGGYVTDSTPEVFCILGFGQTQSYVTQFNTRPFRKTNGKIQLYQNYPINYGICSIFPIKDYYTEVLDSSSVFFNYSGEPGIINGYEGEYADDKNVYETKLTYNSEEFIADYVDKFETYNTLSGDGYIKLDSVTNLGSFLNGMQNSGHNRFDVTLVSPYCCKWRLLGTDTAGDMMRVMYNLRESSIKYTSDSFVKGKIVGDQVVYSATHVITPHIDVSLYKMVVMNGEPETITYLSGKYDPLGENTYEVIDPLNPIDEEKIKNANYIRVVFQTIAPGQVPVEDMYVEVSKINSNTPYLYDDVYSYYVADASSKHIGLLSSDYDSHNFSNNKYVSNFYDDDNGDYQEYIYNGNGSIDDLFYTYNNNNNKFSKIYKYGDNSIEFVSGGVKMRLKSTDKSKINLYKYIGYSAVLLCMSGNNQKRTGTYEVFIDETRGQMAVIVYNGLESDANYIDPSEDSSTHDPKYLETYYRYKHNVPIYNSEYAQNNVIISDDAFLQDDGFTLIRDSSVSTVILTSRPTGAPESSYGKQIVLAGKFNRFGEAGERKIYLDNCKYSKPDTVSHTGIIGIVNNQIALDDLVSDNDNVDCYIKNPINYYWMHRNTLNISQMREFISDYTITIKTESGTTEYNDIQDILSIDIVDSFYLKRENKEYNVVTEGYVHPSYAVPIMNDITAFKYTNGSIKYASDSFDRFYCGANIYLTGLNGIKQTWMKKVIDIDNVMKNVDSAYETDTDVKSYNYLITQKTYTLYPQEHIPKIEIGSVYHLPYPEFSDLEYTVETWTPTKFDTSTYMMYEIKPYELLSPLNNGTWKSDEHELSTGYNFYNKEITQIPDTSYYSGHFAVVNLPDNVNKELAVGERFGLVCTLLTGALDPTCDQVIPSLWEKDSSVFAIEKTDVSQTIKYTLKFDSVESNTNGTILSLRFQTDNTPMEKWSDFWFVGDGMMGEDASVWFKTPSVKQKQRSKALTFTIDSKTKTTEEGYKEATILLSSNDSERVIATQDPENPDSSVLIGVDNTIHYDPMNIDENPDISSVTTRYDIINQSCSLTLYNDNSPLLGYWYSKMCRAFKKYDSYTAYYGAFSGYEKNNFIASRGVCLKSLNDDNEVIDKITISDWYGTTIDTDTNTIRLNITESFINLVNKQDGYIKSWGKCIDVLTKQKTGIDYSKYMTKYIENTILSYIDINKDCIFRIYADLTTTEFGFSPIQSTIDKSKYTLVDNIDNGITHEENRYYMNVRNLDSHNYYAEIIIKL